MSTGWLVTVFVRASGVFLAAASAFILKELDGRQTGRYVDAETDNRVDIADGCVDLGGRFI